MKKLFLWVGGFAIIAIIGAVTATPTPPAATDSVAATPDEPCTATGDSITARTAAQNWCGGGVFRSVDVQSSATTMTAILKFTPKGLSGWQDKRSEFTNGLRQMSNEIVTKADINVAISLHDPSGQLVGGCAQRRTEREAICR